MKQSILGVPSIAVLCLVVFFSTTSFLSQDTRGEILAQARFSDSTLASLPPLGVSGFQSNSTDPALRERLTSAALAYLKAEHNVELTGERPTRQLVTRYDGEQHRERSAEDRISAGLRLHEYFVRPVRRLRDIDVTLTPIALRVEGDKILLQSIEHTTYHYNVSPGVRLPDTSEDEIVHVFVFSQLGGKSMPRKDREATLVPAGYAPKNVVNRPAVVPQLMQECDAYGNCMTYDSTGCDPYGYYACSNDTFDNSTYCCYTEESAYQTSGVQTLDPYDTSRVRTSSCDYGGIYAAAYAYNYAFSNNSSYRRFDNDCTNFVSQAMREGGGFWFKRFGRDYKNWGFWWYDPSGSQNKGQTRTWTQARALEYFIWNSGRGYNTTSICDLDYGDVLVVDWEGDGDIDHAMIVSAAVNCLLGSDGVVLSQHSPGRRNKSLRQYLQEVPTARFHAYWICHNGF